MKRIILVSMAALLLAGYGLAEGMWIDRWAPSGQLRTAVARLDKVPMQVGDWTAQPLELDPQQVEQGEISGHLFRRYVHRGTGQSVNVLLICGRPGPVSVHSPEVCYGGAGFTPGPVTQFTPPDEGQRPLGKLWRAKFQKTDAAAPEALRLCWAWNATGAWEAAGNPRFAYARKRALYKLYVVHQLATPGESVEKDPSGEFLKAFLPTVRKSLFPKS